MPKVDKKITDKNRTDDEKLVRVGSGRGSGSGNDSIREGAISEDIDDVKKRILNRMSNLNVETEVIGKSKTNKKFKESEKQKINSNFTDDLKTYDGNNVDDYKIQQNSLQEGGNKEMNKSISNANINNIESNANELVVLDPDHPQMKRFQKSLKELLEKQTTKISLEIKELSETLKNKKVERENVGVQLYNVQQELIRQQTMLQKHLDNFEKLNNGRQKSELSLVDLKKKFEKKSFNLNKEKKKISQIQMELETLNTRYFYLENAGDNIAGDVALMKRAAIKSHVEINKAEELKHKQDLFVDRLTKKVISLTEELEDLKNQLANQIEDTKLAKETLNESMMELEEVNVEKKRLIQEWNQSVIGLKKRDETYNKMLNELNQLEERTQTLAAEMDGAKIAIEREQETNEKYSEVLSRVEFDIDRVEQQIVECQKSVEQMKDSCNRMGRILKETEQALWKVNEEKKELNSALETLRKQLEKCHEEKVKGEGRLMEKMQDQVNLDKASKFTNKMISKIMSRTRELENQITILENDMTKKSFEETQVIAELSFLEKTSNELKEEIKEKNEVITKNEVEINKRNTAIQRKQNQLDLMIKKLDGIMADTGGLELGPMQLQIKSLQKSISSIQKEIAEAQQLWLKNQGELVKMASLKNEEEASIENLKNRSTVYHQKLLRIEGDIERQKKELSEVERSIGEMRNDTIKLNSLIVKEKSGGENKQQEHKLAVMNYEQTLNDAERELIELEGRLEMMKEEKGRLCEAIMEAEKQLMLWDKKIQLVQEARDSVDGEEVRSEVGSLKNEVHRMEVRLQQINRECEKKCHEMERLIACREVNLVKGDALKARSQTMVKNILIREVTDIKRKIKDRNKEADNYDRELKQLHDEQDRLNERFEKERMKVNKLQQAAQQLEEQLQQTADDKYVAFIDTLVGQQKIKNFQQQPQQQQQQHQQQQQQQQQSKAITKPEVEYRKQLDRMHDIVKILNKLKMEFPEASRDLQKVLLTYGSRALSMMD